MKVESLLSAVAELATGNQPDALVPAPESVNIGKPGEKFKEAKQSLMDRMNEDLADLKGEVEDTKAKIEQERQTIAEAQVNATEAIASGAETHESLSLKRGRALVSEELIYDLEEQLDRLEDKLAKERSEHMRIVNRFNGWCKEIEVRTRRAQIDRIQYPRGNVMHQEVYDREMNYLLAWRQEAQRLLPEKLAEELEAELTWHVVPPTYIECLWEAMSDKQREKHAEQEPVPTIIELPNSKEQ